MGTNKRHSQYSRSDMPASLDKYVCCWRTEVPYNGEQMLSLCPPRDKKKDLGNYRLVNLTLILGEILEQMINTTLKTMR